MQAFISPARPQLISLVNFNRPPVSLQTSAISLREWNKRTRYLSALGACFIWGVVPACFKLIQQVVPDEIMTHCVIWSALFMLLSSVSRGWHMELWN